VFGRALRVRKSVMRSSSSRRWDEPVASGWIWRCSVCSRSSVWVELTCAAVRTASRPSAAACSKLRPMRWHRQDRSAKAACPDPPGLVVAHRGSAQRDGLLGLAEVTRALAKVRGERGFGIEGKPRRLAVTVGWAGNSRAYWIPQVQTESAPSIKPTEDDLWLAQVLAAGTLTPEQAATDRRAHAITAWLGEDATHLDPHVITSNRRDRASWWSVPTACGTTSTTSMNSPRRSRWGPSTPAGRGSPARRDRAAPRRPRQHHGRRAWSSSLTTSCPQSEQQVSICACGAPCSSSSGRAGAWMLSISSVARPRVGAWPPPPRAAGSRCPCRFPHTRRVRVRYR
jgi:hypothetical protein